MSTKGDIKDRKLPNVKGLHTIEEIDEFKWALRRVGTARDVFLFTFGINTGLRVSDIVPLTVEDVRGRTYMQVKEKKTDKSKRVDFPKGLREDIDDYTKYMKKSDYLFPSQKGGHITTKQAYRVLQKAADLLEREDIGTHTMRKTFGYMHYKRNKDVAMLQTIFNHSSPQITLDYIGVTAEEIKNSLEDFYL